MRAVILASGMARRLSPLTDNLPKCLVDVAGVTILERIVSSLLKNNVDDIVITTGYLEDKIKNFIQQKFPQLKVLYVRNSDYEKTNYIYSFYLAKEAIGDDDIVLLHADLVFEPILMQKIINQKKSGVLLKRTLPYPEKDFKASIKNGLVNKIGVDIKGENLRFLAPIYKFVKDDLKKILDKTEEFVNSGRTNCYLEDAFNEISSQVLLWPVYFDNEFCMEIDDFEDLDKARKYFALLK